MIINRSELKFKAKEVLKTNYWISFAICLIVSTVSQLFSMTIRLPEESLENFELSSLLSILPVNSDLITSIGLFGIIAVLIFLFLLSIAFSFFLVNPLTVSANRYFIKSANEPVKFSVLGDIFKSNCYLNVVKTMFMKNIIIAGYYLILSIPLIIMTTYISVTFSNSYIMLLSPFGMIPGIIKEYSYYMVDYIIAENPTTKWRDALKQSNEMMKNCRFETFILSLSFFGWILVGIMVCGVGVYFVTPYIEATLAQLYLDRKKKTYPEEFYGDNHTNYGEF